MPHKQLRLKLGLALITVLLAVWGTPAHRFVGEHLAAIVARELGVGEPAPAGSR